MLAQPVAGGELLEQGAVEAAMGMEIDALDDGALAQPGLAQPGLVQATKEALVLAAGRLAIHEQPEPVLAAEFAGIGRVLQLDERLGHRGEAKRAQALDGWVDQHRASSQR